METTLEKLFERGGIAALAVAVIVVFYFLNRAGILKFNLKKNGNGNTTVINKALAVSSVQGDIKSLTEGIKNVERSIEDIKSSLDDDLERIRSKIDEVDSECKRLVEMHDQKDPDEPGYYIWWITPTMKRSIEKQVELSELIVKLLQKN